MAALKYILKELLFELITAVSAEFILWVDLRFAAWAAGTKVILQKMQLMRLGICAAAFLGVLTQLLIHLKNAGAIGAGGKI